MANPGLEEKYLNPNLNPAASHDQNRQQTSTNKHKQPMNTTLSMDAARVNANEQNTRNSILSQIKHKLKQSPWIGTALITVTFITIALFLRIAFIFHHLNSVLREIHAINA
jgi:hypothetical protein